MDIREEEEKIKLNSKKDAEFVGCIKIHVEEDHEEEGDEMSAETH